MGSFEHKEGCFGGIECLRQNESRAGRESFLFFYIPGPESHPSSGCSCMVRLVMLGPWGTRAVGLFREFAILHEIQFFVEWLGWELLLGTESLRQRGNFAGCCSEFHLF